MRAGLRFPFVARPSPFLPRRSWRIIKAGKKTLQDRPIFRSGGTERWDASSGSKRARQPTVRDCLFLVIIAILSLSLYVADLGFYSDDWALLSSMHLSSDQSLVGVFSAVDSSQDNEIRLIQFFGYAVSYKLFGLNPLGYHLINTIFFVTSFAFLYLILREFRQPRALCLAIPIIYMLLPAYSTDRFWIAAHATNISMGLSFL